MSTSSAAVSFVQVTPLQQARACGMSGSATTASPCVHDLVVSGRVDNTVDDGLVHYFAAAPPDYRSSFSGSALPFATPDQAFYGTCNRGTVKVADGSNAFEIRLRAPNAYYVGLGSVYVPPTVYMWYVSNGQRMQAAIKVSEGVPFRTLTYPSLPTRPRKDVMFYAPPDPDAPVRSQEQILRDSAYPGRNAMPADFWGKRPPSA